MNRVSAADVDAAGRRLLDHGRGRIAILGADSDAVDGWIAGGKMDRLAALRWPEVAASCPRPDTTTRVIRMAPSRAQTTLYAFSCISSSLAGAPNAAVLVANFILGGSEDAVLAHRLRGELGLAYGFSNRVIGVWDAPVAVWLLTIGSQDANADRVIAEIRSLLATVIADGPSALLLESARTALAKTRLDQATDGLPWVTSVLWRGVAPELEAQRVRDVTLADVRDALGHWATAGIGVVRSGNPQ
jgi:predicted Zn-dependent peptidase